MNYKRVLEEIQEKQLSTFCTVEDFRNNRNKDPLETHHRGLYWIWTNLSYSDLQNIPTTEGTNEVPISELVEQRQCLKYICNIIYNKGFKIVYNGMGGYYSESSSFGLRERILQELNCNSITTGTLNLCNRKNSKIENWAVSYFDFDGSKNTDFIKEKGITYNDHAAKIESYWRIEYGIPILTRY